MLKDLRVINRQNCARQDRRQLANYAYRKKRANVTTAINWMDKWKKTLNSSYNFWEHLQKVPGLHNMLSLSY